MIQGVFYSIEKVERQQVVQFNLTEFTTTMNSERPKSLFCVPYSSKTPLFEILEYTDNGVRFTCNAWADKTPQWKSMPEFYRMLQIDGGLENYTYAT